MNRLQSKIIADALENDHLLSAWECDFINDMASKPDGYELSEKQNAIVNKIGSRIAEQ